MVKTVTDSLNKRRFLRKCFMKTWISVNRHQNELLDDRTFSRRVSSLGRRCIGFGSASWSSHPKASRQLGSAVCDEDLLFKNACGRSVYRPSPGWRGWSATSLFLTSWGDLTNPGGGLGRFSSGQ